MGNLYYSLHLTGCIQKAQQCTQIHNKIQVHKTYCAESLLLKFYHSEFKIHNVSQAQSSQLVLQTSLFMARTAKEHSSQFARLRTWSDILF